MIEVRETSVCPICTAGLSFVNVSFKKSSRRWVVTYMYECGFSGSSIDSKDHIFIEDQCENASRKALELLERLRRGS